ncbi:SusC/RagA family TonB-linked outer membrane protein [Longimicrobium sp.]|jgi:TonB-linked SusC/RagA family outer membrane protein|uniref:SusC/RagA family TonB-linked outer membrane protein n=1 Tax=Longimicrobium sp. TaxID=2029185 RepID=UPI002ED84AB0
MGFPIQRKGWLRLAAAVGLLCAAAPSLAAQGGTIRGTVVESGNRQPLAGATVAGGGRSTVTNAAGEFTLSEVSAGRVQVRATRLGYQAGEASVSVSAGETVRADLALAPATLGLDAIVVTGTPGATARRTVGNAITQLDVEEVTAVTNVTNVAEILQARTPGVQIVPNAGTPGAAPDIRIRGASSFLGNQPVVYVDGIRYDIGSLGNFSPGGAGLTPNGNFQTTSGLSFLNPEDIESIEVIKGPAASTLYGAEAASGVIQIITKRGGRGQQRPQWGFKFEAGRSDLALDLPINYTTCDSVKQADAAGWPGCVGVPRNTVLTDRPMLRDPDALRDGNLNRVTMSVRGGGDRYSYYVAGDLNNEDGVLYNSYSRSNSVRANFGLNPSSELDFQVNTSYIQGRLRLPVGDESGNGLLLSAVRGRPGRVATNADPLRSGWAGLAPYQANEYNNLTNTDRLTLGITANYRPWEWFRNRLTVGVDFASNLAQIISEPGSTDSPSGLTAQRAPRNHFYTLDYAGSVVNDLTDAVESTTSFGVNVVNKQYETLFASGVGLGAPDVTLIGSAQTRDASNAFTQQKSLGLFAQQQFGFRNRLYLTGALRMDNNSAFGAEIHRLLYPKAALSWVLSDEPGLAPVFERIHASSFKFRTAWGQAGRAPDPYSATQTFTINTVALGTGSTVTTGSALRTSSYGNPDLKPERGSELEIGFDAAFLDDRVGIDFTHYNKRMVDVIVAQAIPGSSGFASSRFYNLGETLNTGIELGLNATPVDLRNFRWESRLNLSTNRNELVSFGDTAKKFENVFSSYASNIDAAQRHAPGYPLAGFWGRFPELDANGNVKFNAAGNAVVLEADPRYIGPALPTREIGFSNSVTLFRYLRLYGLLDYKGGNYVFNFKEFGRCNSNLNCAVVNDATVGDTAKLLARTNRSQYVERADFIKLRDLSLTYTVPGSLLSRTHTGMRDVSVTLAGHNLALWTDYSGIDPEVNTAANRLFARTDAYSMPMNRRVSVAVNLSF